MKILNINKNDKYLHLSLLKYYYNFIESYKLDENKDTDVLHFDFGEETYSIVFSLLKDKAHEESFLITGLNKNYKI